MQIPNLVISVIENLEQRQLAVIRSISLKQTASDPRTINGTAKVESEARNYKTLLGIASSTRRSLTQKIDGLVALSMALGSMSADEVVSATSPWDDPEFKLAV